MSFMQTRFALLIAASALLTGIAGCPQQTTPESVLEGTWQLIPGQTLNPPLTDWFLTFNSKGELIQIKYTFANTTTVTWDAPSSNVLVDGDALSISVDQGGSSLEFNGTLDSATEPTGATGTMTSTLEAGSVTVTVSRGTATLVKQ